MPGGNVGDVCPECGAEARFDERAARILRGHCAGCGRTFTILQEEETGEAATRSVAPAGTASEPASPSAPKGPDASRQAASGPPCGVCGASMDLRPASDTSLEGLCRSCGTTFTYVLAEAPVGGPPERSFPERPRSAPGARRFPPSRGRPCRECGGPLSFSTDDEGNVTGECASCGNRFTLPPRREFGGGRPGQGRRRDFRKPFPPSARRPGQWPRLADGERPRRFRGAGAQFRRRPRRPRPDEEDDGEERPRRARRD